MTKRFTTDNGSNEDVCLVDNVTGNEYESNFGDIVVLLNELHEDLNHELTVSKALRDVVKELEKENEQLKQKLELYGEIYPTGKWITKLNSEELKKELLE